MPELRSMLEKAAFGVPAGWESRDIYSPSQMGVMNRMQERGEQRMSQPFQGFDPIRQDTLRSFREDILPSVAERIGGRRAQSGYSTAQDELYQRAQENIAQRLAGMQAQYGLAQQQLGMQELGATLRPQQDYYPVAAQRGFAQDIGPQIASGVAQAIPGVIGKGIEYGSEFLPAGFRQAGQLAGKGIQALNNYFSQQAGPSSQLFKDLPLSPQARSEAREQWIEDEGARQGVDWRQLGIGDYEKWLNRKRTEWAQAEMAHDQATRQRQEAARSSSPQSIMGQKARGEYTPTLSERLMQFAGRFLGER